LNLALKGLTAKPVGGAAGRADRHQIFAFLNNKLMAYHKFAVMPASAEPAAAGNLFLTKVVILPSGSLQ
jgi:hypothetical protein